MRRREFTAGLALLATFGSAQAQQPMPTVGVVTGSPSRSESVIADWFLGDMRKLGWEDGGNYHVLFLWTEGRLDRVPALIGELVARRVNVIVTFGDPSIRAAQHTTSTIPVVGASTDLVKSGLAATMARPGSNITGVSIISSELNVKRLELLHEAVPAAKRIGLLVQPNEVYERAQLDMAARELGLELVEATVRNPEDLPNALDKLGADKVDAVNVLGDSPIFGNARFRGLIVERLNRMRLPVIYELPDLFCNEGALLCYGPRLQLVTQILASLVAKILRGARPEDLPVEQPNKFDLVVNLKIAKALGIEIPGSLLARADEVIE